ncbi:MAG: hypothetical protein NC123_04895 [Butyrivibrio sp.]|nr:hypothetical protein [Acetatifactor muris]MCM1558865.1 hypothetical protein [Butyrivibrio sp.]
MKAYHMSETLKAGDTLEVEHQKLIKLAEPFLKSLKRSIDCFYGMILNGKYLEAVLEKSGMWEWADYAKWATEGAFEYIRRTEFPNAISRLKCNFFYNELENVRLLYEYDWGDEPEEIQNRIHLFEVMLDDDAVQRYDMSLYDQAYDAMEGMQDVQTVLACARKYFAGEHTEKPVWEILSDKNILITKDITALLR